MRLMLADTGAVASQFGVAVGTVRRWASEDRWTPHGTRRTRRWDLDEAAASWARRHADAQLAS